ncbi:hypothetical protein [Micromonospora parva]|uniref:hypothetical protein n=1 Tax=Micromonospora parva TaxID=1464048 RepID=UPI003656BB72
MIENHVSGQTAGGTLTWAARWTGIYVAILTAAWLLLIVLADAFEVGFGGLIFTYFAFVLLPFAVPTAALLVILHMIARERETVPFRPLAIALIVPGALAAFFIGRMPVIITLVAAQLVFALVVQRPPHAAGSGDRQMQGPNS